MIPEDEQLWIKAEKWAKENAPYPPFVDDLAKGYYEGLKVAAYWRERCEAAENVIDEFKKDPDTIILETIGYRNWQRLKNKGVQP